MVKHTKSGVSQDSKTPLSPLGCCDSDLWLILSVPMTSPVKRT